MLEDTITDLSQYIYLSPHINSSLLHIPQAIQVNEIVMYMRYSNCSWCLKQHAFSEVHLAIMANNFDRPTFHEFV